MDSLNISKNGRVSFTHIEDLIEIPDLLAIQTKAYEQFLQEYEAAEAREDLGLQSVLNSVFPIEDSHKNYILEFNSYYLGQPKYTADECVDRGVTFSTPLRVKLSLHITDENNKNEYAQSIEQDVYFGNIPYMTEKGTFIINGAERVIVSQLQRSPGVFFDESTHPNGTKLYQARIIPARGSWVDFTTDINDCLFVIIDRRRKFPVTMLLRALGYSSNSDICKAFGSLITLDLKSGDIVEIETSKNQTPNSGWLKFVKTSRAKHEISKYLRKVELEESLKIGSELIEKNLRKLKIFDRVSEFKKNFSIAGYKTTDSMISDIGRGGSTIKDLLPKIFPDLKSNKNKDVEDIEFVESARSDFDGINLDGVKNLVVEYGKCCNPIPGDEVVGYISRGRGLIVHMHSCSNLSSLSSKEDRLVSVNWNTKQNLSFRSKIHITCNDTAGMLNDIADVISKNKVNILDVSTDVTEGGMANIWIICKVESRQKLDLVIKAIQKIRHVDSVERVHE